MATTSQSSVSNSKNNEIENISLMSEHMSQLCFNEEFSDVIFITVDGERVPAHRLILATRSEYFKAMLYGGLAETTQKEVKVQASGEVFKLILQYLYSGRLSLDSIKKEILAETLSLAHLYDIKSLGTTIAKHFEKNLSIKNIDHIFFIAQLYRLNSFSENGLKFMDRYASDVLGQESFLELPRDIVVDLLKRKTFIAPEIEIFRFIWKWLERHPEEKPNAAEITSLVRLPLLTQDQLLNEVTESDLFDHKSLFGALLAKKFPEKLAKRRAEYGKTLMELNVAGAGFNAKVLKGINPNNLFGSVTTQYTQEMSDSGSIVVALDDLYGINHIRMHLFSDNHEEYSYYVEISQDQADWERVVDYRAYRCRSWQSLYFRTRPVRYIRLVGNVISLKVNSFEAKCVQNVPNIVNQIIEWKENVATRKMGAKVIAGQVLNASSAYKLFNGGLNPDYGYDYHYIGDRSNITIQLGQPYIIGSMRLLLFPKNDYKFYIQTSLDRFSWEMAVDKRNDWQREWVESTFSPRPTVFIRITVTDCNQKDYTDLCCLHIECSSQKSAAAVNRGIIHSATFRQQI